jgi:gamma-aminobutyric acid type B receptor
VNLGEYSRFHGYAYDGIWAIALALHNISKYMDLAVGGGGGVVNINNRPTRNVLKSFRYHDEGWERAFLGALEDTFFMGVTGPVRFRDNGRKGTVLIKQFQGKVVATASWGGGA